ncbi:phosphoethanolamine transferase [uncultured Algibacter sp.]|uniref:phosphoethanolamine transferase n=1 Tax=uncultured Algibacter sp. TaxID=298659 RepID=UPI002629C83E|nr:phosphoethanolamine transferase [uncultured Algibacter sp.]
MYKAILPVKINIPFIVLTMASIFLYNTIESRRPNTLKTRLPYSVFFGIKEYLVSDKYNLNEIPKTVYSPIDSLKIVFVLGETVRADHLQINGYSRETTPLLSKRNKIVSFPNVFTPYTYTGASLPRIMTNASVEDENLKEITSVFDVFNACKYETIWFGNQELEISFESITRTNKQIVLIDSLRSYMSFKKVLDEELLVPFKNSFLENEANALYSLHMLGSHWWYENRYSPSHRKFKPVIDSKYIPSLSKEEIINSYDNTIYYLDNFLNQVIEIQDRKNYPSILIYLSDHGEVLGEEGKWLHAQESEFSKNPAAIVWYSDEFQKRFPNKIKALKNNKNKRFTTDLLYHSLLDLLEVKNIYYNKSKSVFFQIMDE